MLEFRIIQNQFVDGYSLFIVERNPDGSRNLGQPVKLEPVAIEDEGMCDPAPTAYIGETALQGVFEQLWRMGFRPKNLEIVQGELTATKYHLEDARSLVQWLQETFGLLDNIIARGKE